jgi:hypothetical protein
MLPNKPQRPAERWAELLTEATRIIQGLYTAQTNQAAIGDIDQAIRLILIVLTAIVEREAMIERAENFANRGGNV